MPPPLILSRPRSGRVEGRPAARLRSAFFLVELLMGVLLLSLAIIPLYQMFVTSSRTMFYSKLSYMAMHVAREELEELRQLPFEKVAGGDLAHDWAPVSGRMLARSLKYRVPEGVTSKLDTEAHSYPKEYERIQTKLEVSEVDPPDARLRKVVLQVRWQEMGEAPKEGDAGQRAALSRFETIVAAHNVPVPAAP